MLPRSVIKIYRCSIVILSMQQLLCGVIPTINNYLGNIPVIEAIPKLKNIIPNQNACFMSVMCSVALSCIDVLECFANARLPQPCETPTGRLTPPAHKAAEIPPGTDPCSLPHSPILLATALASPPLLAIPPRRPRRKRSRDWASLIMITTTTASKLFSHLWASLAA